MLGTLRSVGQLRGSSMSKLSIRALNTSIDLNKKQTALVKILRDSCTKEFCRGNDHKEATTLLVALLKSPSSKHVLLETDWSDAARKNLKTIESFALNREITAFSQDGDRIMKQFFKLLNREITDKTPIENHVATNQEEIVNQEEIARQVKEFKDLIEHTPKEKFNEIKSKNKIMQTLEDLLKLPGRKQVLIEADWSDLSKTKFSMIRAYNDSNLLRNTGKSLNDNEKEFFALLEKTKK
ncbi:hypothetical protein DID74_02740 [Candidatus Marinamargulisbacteria bacterium SCGC AG-333-B06]|nr:hypothetical protein DID74_02740 [Candidatus Marinamargulisbacteria bacterium SCGC AG-333-B06]